MSWLSKVIEDITKSKGLAPIERKVKHSVKTLTTAVKDARRQLEFSTEQEIRENWDEDELRALLAEILRNSTALRVALKYFEK